MNRTVLLMAAMIVLTGCARRDSTEEAAPADTTTSVPAGEAGSAPAEPAPDQAAPTEPGTTPADVAADPEAGAGPGACDAEASQRFVGEIYTPELGEQARVAAGAEVARALRPGEVVTMEFRADRLSLTLDESGRIVRASCG
jgi:Peptidase inhibitor I78 family